MDSFRNALCRVAPVPEVELEFVTERSAVREYAAGASLLNAGEIPTRVWYLCDGFLRFYYVTDTGREFNKAFARPGEVVVPLAGTLSGAPSEFQIEAVTTAITVALPATLIAELFDRHPVWDRVGRILAEQMALRKEARERELLIDPAVIRYRRFSERYPELVAVVPQRQIASYIGVTEQALSRILRAERAQR